MRSWLLNMIAYNIMFGIRNVLNKYSFFCSLSVSVVDSSEPSSVVPWLFSLLAIV